MHWLDVLVMMLIGFGTYAGYKRGLVLELTDWAIMIFASLAAFRGFRPLAGFMHRMFPGWTLPYCESIAFWILMLFFGLAILSAGLHIDRATREFDRIPPEARAYGGTGVAFFKTIVLSCLMAAMLPMSSGLAPAEKRAVKKSASAGLLRGISAPVTAVVSVITPADLAKKFSDSLR